jgi:GDPmannose 4,6-dehydratase
VKVALAETADDFIVATGQSHSVAEFVASAFAAVGIDDWQRYVETDPRFVRPVDQPEQRGDPSKIERELGWTRTHGFDDVVAAMARYDLELLASDS